jgi:putative heme iron utilization protein
MADQPQPAAEATRTNEDASEVLRVLRQARFAALATLDAGDGAPFASLVNLALLPGGTPLILISTLARHTANLRANAAASLLVTDGAAPGGDPLAGSRVTLTGRFGQLAGDGEIEAAREIFVGLHPAAAGYAGFGDFGWWTMQVEKAHLVAGFGRIRTLQASEFLTLTR